MMSFLSKQHQIIGACGVIAIGCGAAYLVRQRIYDRCSTKSDIPNNLPAHNDLDVHDNDSTAKGKKVKKDECKVLMVGLDGAGKSCVISCLSKNAQRREPEPTAGFNVMCIRTHDQQMNILEVGGAETVRTFWNKFTDDTDLVVFVVDASQPERFSEASSALSQLLRDDKLADVPIVILANKQDLSGAKNKNEVYEALGCQSLKQGKIVVLETSVPIIGTINGIEEVEAALDDLTADVI